MAGLLAGLFFLLFGIPLAHAHQIPPGCTGSGLGISLFTDKINAHVGETICYSALVFNTPFPACLAENVAAGIVTPDGVTNRITLRRTTLNPGDSDFYTNVVCYIVRAQDVLADGTVRATAFDNGLIHQNETDSQGGGFQGVNTEIAFPCILVTKQCTGGVGETGAILFTGTVRNCGNIPLVNVTVTNFVNGGSFRVLGPVTLNTNQTLTFQGSYVPLDPCRPTTDTLVAQGFDTLPFSSNVVSTVTATCANVLTPGIRVTKFCPPGPVSPGQLLVYSGNVTNTGNVTLTNIVVVSDQPAPNTTVFTLASLAPGAVANFTGSYTAPTNCATASGLTARGTSICGVAVTDAVSSTCPILTTPQILVSAICSTNPVGPSGVLTYNGFVQNTGNITLTNVVVVSDRPAANTTVFTVAALAPGATANFTGSYTATANTCSSTANLTATGRDLCTGTAVSNTASATCLIATAPRIAVTLACPPVAVAPGAVIVYAGTVSNPGNVTLNNVVVVNNQVTPNTVVMSVASLAPGASTNFTMSITAPADVCSVTSGVTASGSDACTTLVVSNSASATCPLVTTPRIAVTLTCPTSPVTLGGVLTYNGFVQNTGNITLTNVVVVNDRTGNTPVFTVASLTPGAVANFTGSFTVPVSSSCSISSTLTASGSDKCTSARVTANSSATCPLLGAPTIAVTLSCPVTPVALGGTLTFNGVVNNTGNVTLTNVVVVSDLPTPGTVVFSRATLAPGATATFTGSYAVPRTNACSVTTTVNASATDQCGGSGIVASATITCPLITAPRIVVTQVCPPTPAAPGGVVAYSGTVSNAGNITLTNVVVVSSLPAPNTVVFTVASLEPGASANFNGSYTAPLDTCSVSSTLVASGQDRCTGVAVTNSVTTTCPLVTSPQLVVTKACPPQPVIPGGTLVFTGTVANTGNVTLTGVVVVNNQPAPNTAVFGPITLAPGVSTNFTGSYTVPANVCSITDTLTATGRDKCTSSNVVASVTTICPVQTAAQIRVTKTCPALPVAPGGLMTFAGTVSNPGNTTLTNITVVNDQPAPNTVVFTLATLAPGASANFTGSYTVGIVNACTITDTLTASAQDRCGGNGIVGTVTTTCALLTAPKIAVTKACPPNPVAPGDQLVFSGTVTNVGNITLTNVIVVNNKPVPNTPVFGPVTLAPGQGASFSGSYTMPTNNACTSIDTLTASGNDLCTGTTVTAGFTAICPVLTSPRIKVHQVCPPTPPVQGGTLTYTGFVQNTGNITLTNVVVVNSLTGNTPVFTVATLAPGVVANFTGSFRVPLNCCSVSSTLTATGRDICPGTIVTDTFTATCPVLTAPKIVVTKVCAVKTLEPGDLLKYSGTVSNAGNITLVNVIVTDNQPTAGTRVLGPIILAPGESVSYAGSYIVPVDFCGTDTVTASGVDECTKLTVTDSVTATCPILTSPRIAVTQNCPPSPTPRGGLHTFTGTVSNPGNVTLTNVFVFNNQPSNNTPVIGPITLAPGASVNFTGSYLPPAACCEILNTVTARGQDRCVGTTVSATSSALCPLLSTPLIAVTRVCPPAAVPVGGVFVFKGTVRNSGDVFLTNVFVFSSRPAIVLTWNPGTSGSGVSLASVSGQNNEGSVQSTMPDWWACQGLNIGRSSSSLAGNNTAVLGPIELAPGESKEFSGSYVVTAGINPLTDTVTASGTDTCQTRTVTATANCAGPVVQSPPVIGEVTLANGMVKVSWSSTAGITYCLQYSTGSKGATWVNCDGHVTATGTTAFKEQPVGTDGQRFYRVMVIDGSTGEAGHSSSR
jgi:uncharacterized repeat protein (TIGR01451 family)